MRATLRSAKQRVVAGALMALPDAFSLRLQYRRELGRWPDLADPRRFTEKIQVLKLRGGLRAHAEWIDKVIAKERVAALLGPQWVTPTLWHGPALPPQAERTWPGPFVLKANHGSGWYAFVDDAAGADWPMLERETASWLRLRWHRHLRERQYDGIVPQLLVEPRLGDGPILPYDYKFWVFHGRVEYVIVSMERLQGLKFAVFDRDWNRLDLMSRYAAQEAEPAKEPPPKPPHYAEMLRAAELLASPFRFARIDLYDLPDGPRFGEITLTPSSGHEQFEPDSWDFAFGAKLDVTPLLTRPQ